VDRPLEGRLRDESVRQAQVLVRALGYDMDTVEFAVRDDTLYAIDFLNPAPDFDSFSIKEEAFSWVVQHMADLVIAYATGERSSPWEGRHRFWAHLGVPAMEDPADVVSR
jgi:hypothetical protein